MIMPEVNSGVTGPSMNLHIWRFKLLNQQTVHALELICIITSNLITSEVTVGRCFSATFERNATRGGMGPFFEHGLLIIMAQYTRSARHYGK